MTKLEDFLNEKITELEKNNLLRELKVFDQENLVDFSSNDYLGLAKISHDNFEGKSGSTGSRLITGTHDVHVELEALVAKWKKTEAALFFGSGYLANLGTIAALLGPRDVVFSDELNHSCINEGIRLSGAKKFFYRHKDSTHLKELLEKHRSNYKQAMIITDSIFSMDGDRADLQTLVELKNQHHAFLYIDEAHAAGVLGSSGAGLLEELVEAGKLKKDDVEVQMGTFSKAIGVEGAYVAGSKPLIKYLISKAKTFMFSTAPSPMITKLIVKNLQTAIDARHLREKLKSNIIFLREQLDLAVIPYINEDTAIFAIEINDIARVLEITAAVLAQGFLVGGIRPPTVTKPRLRVTLTAKHNETEIKALVDSLKSFLY